MTRVLQPQRDIDRERKGERERGRERERERGRERESRVFCCQYWDTILQDNILKMYFRQARQIVSRINILQVQNTSLHPILRIVFHTQNLLLHTDAFAQKLLHTDAFTHRRFYTQKRLHTDAFTHRSFYTQKVLHADTRHFYTHRLLHTDVFTHRH